MGFATHLGPWLLGTVKNTTGTTVGTLQNTGCSGASKRNSGVDQDVNDLRACRQHADGVGSCRSSLAGVVPLEGLRDYGSSAVFNRANSSAGGVADSSEQPRAEVSCESHDVFLTYKLSASIGMSSAGAVWRTGSPRWGQYITVVWWVQQDVGGSHEAVSIKASKRRS